MRPIRILEIVGADKRCSNHTLASFGVCVNQPVMVLGSLVAELGKAFGKRGIEEVRNVQGMMIKNWVPQHNDGHYIIYSRGHAMAVHNGALVDTARRGIGQTKVIRAWKIINFDRQLDNAFKDYERNNPKNVFRGTAQRKPKQRPFSLDVVMKNLARIGYADVFFKDVSDIARANNWGRPDPSGLIFFTQGEARKVIQAFIDKESPFQRVAVGHGGRRRR